MVLPEKTQFSEFGVGVLGVLAPFLFICTWGYSLLALRLIGIAKGTEVQKVVIEICTGGAA